MPDHESAPRREPMIDWNAHDDIPILTDIVDADDVAAPAPARLDGEPDDLPAIHIGQSDFDDGADSAATATVEEPLDLTPLWNSEAAPSPPPASRLDELRAALTAELEVAATRIVAESVDEIEALLIERVSQRIKDEMAGIVGATLHDFERHGKTS